MAVYPKTYQDILAAVRSPKGYDLLTAEKRVERDRLVVAAKPAPPPPPGLKPGLIPNVREACGEVRHGIAGLIKKHPYLSIAAGGLVALSLVDLMLPSKSDTDRYELPRRTIDGVRHPTNQWDKLPGINTSSIMPFTGVTYGSGRDIYAVRALIPKFLRMNKADAPVLNTIAGFGPSKGIIHSLGPASAKYQQTIEGWHARLHKTEMLVNQAEHEITRTSYKYLSPSHRDANLLRQMHLDVIATPPSTWSPKPDVRSYVPMMHASSTRFKPLSNRLKQPNLSPGAKPVNTQAVELAALERMGRPNKVAVMPRHLDFVQRLAAAQPMVHTPRVLNIPIPMTEGISFPFTATVSPLQLGKARVYGDVTSNAFTGGYVHPAMRKVFMAGPVTTTHGRKRVDRPYIEGRMPVLKNPVRLRHAMSMPSVRANRTATYPEPQIILHRSVDPASLEPVGFAMPSLPGIRPSEAMGIGSSFSGGAVPTMENYLRVVRKQDIPYGARAYPGIRFHSPHEPPVPHGDVMPGLAKDMKWFDEGYDPRYISGEMFRFITKGGLAELTASQEKRIAKGLYGDLQRAMESGDKSKYRAVQEEVRNFEKKLRSHMLERYDTSTKFWKRYDRISKRLNIDVTSPLDPKITSRIFDKHMPPKLSPDDIFTRQSLAQVESVADEWLEDVGRVKELFSDKHRKKKGREPFAHDKKRVDRLVALATDDYRFRAAIQQVIDRPAQWSPAMEEMVEKVFGGDRRAFQEACRNLAVSGEGRLPRDMARLRGMLDHFRLAGDGAKLGQWTRMQKAEYGVHYTMKHYDLLFDDLLQAGFSREQSHNISRNLYRISPISSDAINNLDAEYIKIRNKEKTFYDPAKWAKSTGAIMGPADGFGPGMARYHMAMKEFKGFWGSLAATWRKQPAGRMSLFDKLWKTSQITLGMPHSYAANAYLQKRYPDFVSLEEYDKSSLAKAQSGTMNSARSWAVQRGSALTKISRDYMSRGPRGFLKQMAGRAGSAAGRTLSRVGMMGLGSALPGVFVGLRALNIPSQSKTYDFYPGGVLTETAAVVADMSVFTLSFNMFNAVDAPKSAPKALTGFAKFSRGVGKLGKFGAKMGVSGMLAALASELVVGVGHAIFGTKQEPVPLPPGQMLPFRPDYWNGHVLVSAGMSGDTFSSLEPTGMNMTPFGSGYSADNDPALWKPELSDKPVSRPVRHPKTAGLVHTLWHNHKNSNRTLRTASPQRPRQRADRGVAV